MTQTQGAGFPLAISVLAIFHPNVHSTKRAQSGMRFVKGPFRDGDLNFISEGSDLFLDTQT